MKETKKTEKVEDQKQKIAKSINIALQTRIFAVLLMLFASLLLIALLSYTRLDQPNTQVSFFDLFRIFTDDPELKIKFYTSINWLGLLGAYISEFLLANTLGIFVLAIPVIIFIAGFQAFRFGVVSEKLLRFSSTYLLFATLISSFIGALANFKALEGIPLVIYGAIGGFIGSFFASFLSAVGASIIILAAIVFAFVKLTDIRKIGVSQFFRNTIYKIRKSTIWHWLKTNNMDSQISRPPSYRQKSVFEIVDRPITATTTKIDAQHEETPATTSPTTHKSPENIFETKQDILGNNIPHFGNKSVQVHIIDTLPFKETPTVLSENEPVYSQENIEENEPSEENIFAPSTPKPIDITLPSSPIYMPHRESDNVVIEATTPIVIDITKINNQNTDNPIPQNQETKNSNSISEIRDFFRNPLSLGILDENIKYIPPTLDLLEVGSEEKLADENELQANAQILQAKLEEFKINITQLEATRGPVITQYEFVPAEGVKISKIEGLSDDLAMALKAKSVHIIAPVPGKGTVGIQIPNANPSIVRFRSIVSSQLFKNTKYELPVVLGKTVSGEPYIADLTKMPHLLIAGATGAGKSVGVNNFIASLLYRKHPSELKFVIIDPKKVELTQYARLSNHFLAISPDLNTEIVTEPQDAVTVLKALVLEMEKRYSLLGTAKQRNIKDYNDKVQAGAYKNDPHIDHRPLPYIVLIVDELADLMLTAGKEIEIPIARIAQMARAVGIHLIVATQRPSVNIITGTIKANFPTRIAYRVASSVDSRTILDSSGAETLIGNGDMLYNSATTMMPIRIQNPFISTDEVERICDFIGEQQGYSEPYMLPGTYDTATESGEYDALSFDPLFRDAAELFIEQGQASTSMLQRRLKIGFARAGRIVDELSAAGVIGPQQGSKPRSVLMESISEVDNLLG